MGAVQSRPLSAPSIRCIELDVVDSAHPRNEYILCFIMFTPVMTCQTYLSFYGRLGYRLLNTLYSVPVIDPLDSCLGQLTRRVERRCLVGGTWERIWMVPVASVCFRPYLRPLGLQ